VQSRSQLCPAHLAPAAQLRLSPAEPLALQLTQPAPLQLPSAPGQSPQLHVASNPPAQLMIAGSNLPEHSRLLLAAPRLVLAAQ